MNDSSATPTPTTPRHLWIVGALALFWNSFGAFDYLMTETRNASYMSSFTPEQLAYFYAFPTWTIAAWAIGVWGGVLGSALLLLRKRAATLAFGASLIAIAITFLYNYALSDGFRIMGGTSALAFSAAIVIVAAALLLYSRSLAAKSVLR